MRAGGSSLGPYASLGARLPKPELTIVIRAEMSCGRQQAYVPARGGEPPIRFPRRAPPKTRIDCSFSLIDERIMAEDAHDKQVEIWKVKKLVKSLTLARGNGTSMISLVIPPRDQISRVAKMLADEYGTASNIKSRVNRLSVLGAITSEHYRRCQRYK